MPFAEPALTLAHIDLTLGRGEGRVHVLKDVSLEVAKGESIGIIGRSGSGKSTLLMVLAGLERADHGEITVAGQRIDHLNEDQLAKIRSQHIGIVFQSFHLLPTMTALENVAVPLELAGRSDAAAVAARELAAVGLSHRLNHFPSQLSGGEQQRVALARALAPHPAILVADEPTGNLDEQTGSEVQELLFAVAKERGMTLIIVSHDRTLAARCDRRLIMHSGILTREVMP